MTKATAVVVTAAGLLMAACATPVAPVPQPSGGDRAGGTIQMSYIIPENIYKLSKASPYIIADEYRNIDWDSALPVVIERCKAWGYSGAETFGFEKATPAAGDTVVVTREYQCTGDLEK